MNGLCQCTGGFSGPECDQQKCGTTGVCFNGGVCVNGVCDCLNGFIGVDCKYGDPSDQEPVPCGDIECLNGGNCLENACVCDPRFTGDTCEKCAEGFGPAEGDGQCTKNIYENQILASACVLRQGTTAATFSVCTNDFGPTAVPIKDGVPLLPGIGIDCNLGVGRGGCDWCPSSTRGCGFTNGRRYLCYIPKFLAFESFTLDETCAVGGVGSPAGKPAGFEVLS